MTAHLTTFLLAAGLAVASASVEAKTNDSRLYELRTYHAEPGKLNDLLARFRDHTTRLFEKHGMTNIGYWVPVENKDNLLIYLLAHKDAAAAQKSWGAFRADPAWVAVKKASEDAAGGSLTVPDGVKSLFLKPTDFSPVK